MDKKKPRVGSDPLAWIRDTTKTKGQTYHLEMDLVGKIKKYAYWERLKVSEVVNKALREFFKSKKFTK